MDVLGVVRRHLLTPRGVRSLSPHNPFYEPSYGEDQHSQDLASRNGSTWVWPLMFYAKSCFLIGGERFLPTAQELLEGFETEIQTSCIGSLSECFEGDPPFRARGCLSQATSVGGLLYIHSLVEQWKKKVAKEKNENGKKCASKKK